MEQAKPLKVAFVGTSCIGKTTLADAYRARNIPGLVIVDEAARTYFTNNPQVQSRFSVAAQGNVQELALMNEQRAHRSGASRIISDRSVLDAVAYVRSQGDLEGSDLLLDAVRFWLPTYSGIFLLDPADIPYKVDSVRQEDEVTRDAFHQAFIHLFREEGIPYELLSGSVSARMRHVDQVLKL